MAQPNCAVERRGGHLRCAAPKGIVTDWVIRVMHGAGGLSLFSLSVSLFHSRERLASREMPVPSRVRLEEAERPWARRPHLGVAALRDKFGAENVSHVARDERRAALGRAGRVGIPAVPHADAAVVRARDEPRARIVPGDGVDAPAPTP